MATMAVYSIQRLTVSFFRQASPSIVSFSRHSIDFTPGNQTAVRGLTTDAHKSSDQLGLTLRSSALDDSEDLQLSPEQLEALRTSRLGRNMFITGRAGTGKSVLIRKVIREAENQGKAVAITAPTGIAALLIGGRTIHSWTGIGNGEQHIDFYIQRAVRSLLKGNGILGIGIGNDGKRIDLRVAKAPQNLPNWEKLPDLINTDMLVIDEISMVRHSVSRRTWDGTDETVIGATTAL
jgi:ATP-dependent exoDNAse (exonuclease V) alpha subunit